jgi:uncharacterized protein (DUF1778 family)
VENNKEDVEEGKRGRPRKEERMSDHPVYIFMHNKEALETVRRAAEIEGLSVSAWARNVLLKAAKTVVKAHAEE